MMYSRTAPRTIGIAASVALTAFACGSAPTQTKVPNGSPPSSQEARPAAVPGSFADNPIVYFVVTDRFLNGNSSNDRSYGRKPDGDKEIGTFHGGDLAGLTRKLKEGYFTDLGVNGIWITAPYEQIHGWIVGGDKEFQHYAYHGYYALDYTVLDANMGTTDELREFVDTAHAKGIRVIFDVVMNHPGYADLKTLAEYKINVLWNGWENANLENYHSFIDYNNFNFTEWWGPDWVRSGLPGYDEGSSMDELTKQLAYLPDFKTEATKAVSLPVFFGRKPTTRAKAMEGYTVRKYLVKWLTDWVREYGIDGFRCDTAKHVELASWAELKRAGAEALRAWKAANPGKKIDDAEFWMTGEVFPHGVVRSEYFDHGFDNLINFDLQPRIKDWDGKKWSTIDAIYTEYAQAVSTTPMFNVLSYLSSHDTELFDRDRLIVGGTVLMLAPGGVQIFYGDETARPNGPIPRSDPQQGTRSFMNWETANRDVLEHWRKLGQFRQRHVALAKGVHKKLSDTPYTFSRIHPDDRVVVAMGASGMTEVPVGDVFANGETVRDAYTGSVAVVQGGKAPVRAGASGVILLERTLSP